MSAAKLNELNNADEPALIEYVVVHELAHLTVKSHSPDFWGLVSSALPDAQQRRRLDSETALFGQRMARVKLLSHCGPFGDGPTNALGQMRPDLPAWTPDQGYRNQPIAFRQF